MDLVNVDLLADEFFMSDDLKRLSEHTGILLKCPIMVLDDAFRVIAGFAPPDFSDAVFKNAVSCGAISYESGAEISKNERLRFGETAYIKLDGSPFKHRFAPLISTGVMLGYFVCVDTDGHLQGISAEIWKKIEMILSKQLFIEASRQDKPFETTEEILMHLLSGGFPSEQYFRLQSANTYLASFKPTAFALIDLTVYNSKYMGNRHLKDEINMHFDNAHEFLYKGDIFLFLHDKHDISIFSELAREFGLKVIISDPVNNLFSLPSLYASAREALEMIIENDFGDTVVSSVAQLRIPLMLKKLSGRDDFISPELLSLAEYDRQKGSEYCQTLYCYLINNRSLKKTCDSMFTHRNTVLYRIDKIRNEFLIPLDEPSAHVELLIGAALLIFKESGPSFFINKQCRKGNELK